MPVLSFQKQFSEKVQKGIKTQTVRATRKRPIKVGEKLFLYTGMRTKACRLLGYGVCTDVSDFEIRLLSENIYINKKILNNEEKERFALADGFNSFKELLYFFFKDGEDVIFRGHVYSWEYKKEA